MLDVSFRSWQKPELFQVSANTNTAAGTLSIAVHLVVAGEGSITLFLHPTQIEKVIDVLKQFEMR